MNPFALLGSFVLGALVGGFVVKNNKDKAFAALELLKSKAEEERSKLKK
jgi:hypothetical protein